MIPATKLNLPPVRASLVPRPRLTQRLAAGLGGALTLVSAPAGSGKTTLITEWLAASVPPPAAIAWLSLDEDDNDPLRFLSGLAAALRQGGALAGGSALRLLQSPRPQQFSPRTLLTALLNAFEARPAPAVPTVLVLDDYHVISADAVHAAVSFLLERRPAGLHLVLTTRTEPPIPLARLRAHGQLTELRAEDLHFTLDEAAAFLNAAMGLRLAREQVAALAQRTEGWIAALQLAALALQTLPALPGAAPRAEFVASFTGSHRHVLDYLVEEVLSRQTEPVRAFLRQTSILNRLHGPLCEAVTGQPGGQAMLAALERANLFLVPLDGDRQWYRYHHLFAEALRAQLAQAAPGAALALHARASRWFAQHDLPAEAIHHALAAEDFEHAGHLIDVAADALIRRGELETIRAWVQAVPAPVTRARPGLCLWQAWTLIPQGRYAEGEAYALAAEAGVRPEREALLAAPASDAARARLTQIDFLLGQSLLARCSAAQHQNDLARATELARQALAILPPQALSLRSLAQLDLAHIYLLQGEVTPAAAALEQALASIQGDYHPFIHLQILTKLAEVRLQQMRLHAAAELCREAVTLAAAQRVEALAAEAWLYLGELAREWNALDEAGAHLARCVALCEQSGEGGTARRAYSVWARVHAARGDWAAAAACHARSSRSPAEQAWLWLAQGNLAAARQVVDRRARHPAGAYADLLLARVRLAQGRGQVALAVLSRWRAPAQASGRQDLALAVAVLQALAYQMLAQWPQALRALDRALALAEPAGCLRTFLDEGAPMAALLARHAATQAPRPYVLRLLAQFPPGPNPPPTSPPVSNGYAAEPLEPLRAREADILRLLAAGLSNPEIAAELSLSVNTVRWYLKQLYRKLAVHSRTQAALKARELAHTPPPPTTDL